MKAIIDGKVFDTEKARLLAYSNVDDRFDPYVTLHDGLYQTASGELFMESYRYLNDAAVEEEIEIVLEQPDHILRLVSAEEAKEWVEQFGDMELMAYLFTLSV